MSIYKKQNQIQLYLDRKIPYTLDLNIGDENDQPVDLTVYKTIIAKVREYENKPVVAQFEILKNAQFLQQGRLIAVLKTNVLKSETYYFDILAYKTTEPEKLISGVITVRPTYSI